MAAKINSPGNNSKPTYLIVGFEPPSDGIRLVVVSLHQIFSRNVVLPSYLGRLVRVRVYASWRSVDPTL